MQEILQLLTSEGILKEWDIMDDKQMVAIYEATTWEEVEQYNAIIELFLENETVPFVDLQKAVSWVYLKLNLLERKLISE